MYTPPSSTEENGAEHIGRNTLNVFIPRQFDNTFSTGILPNWKTCTILVAGV